MNCPKCTGLVVPKWGWSDNDLRGTLPILLVCVLRVGAASVDRTGTTRTHGTHGISLVRH